MCWNSKVRDNLACNDHAMLEFMIPLEDDKSEKIRSSGLQKTRLCPVQASAQKNPMDDEEKQAMREPADY